MEHPFREHKAHLVQLVQHNLHETLFESRAFLRPNQVASLASAIAEAFFDFLESPDSRKANATGADLCHRGVGAQAILQVGQCLRRFCWSHYPDNMSVDCMETTEAFHHAVVQGYFAASQAIILAEQERIRSALQHTLHRYTLQLETAAEVARAAISTLDLGTLLTIAVDLIGERFGLDYVAIYLVDEDNGYVELRAATGLEGRVRLAARHKLKANSASTVGRCLISKRHVLLMAQEETGGATGASWLPETKSEIALPLITHDKVIGVLSAQSKRSGAFSSQDVVGFQIMSDQLANAIENARLYADARQRAEDLAQAYDQLKELEFLKDQFMQNVSHELRTPLTMIRGYTELLLMDEEDSAPSERVEALHVILRNTQALTELVADIMAMLEASASRLSLTVTSMSEAVRDSVTSFQYLADQKDLTLDADLPEAGVSCDVMARQDHLRRVTDNLLANAIKFTPTGGRVAVRLWQNAGRVHLEVADTGMGIPAHLLERIFERFFQVDSSQRRAHGGTGLGLALVKELVESYGGAVSAASPGTDQGSTFTVVLPLVAS